MMNAEGSSYQILGNIAREIKPRGAWCFYNICSKYNNISGGMNAEGDYKNR